MHLYILPFGVANYDCQENTKEGVKINNHFINVYVRHIATLLCSTYWNVTMFKRLQCYYVCHIAQLLCFSHCNVTMLITFQHCNVHHVVMFDFVRHILMSSYVFHMTRFVCLRQIMKINFWKSFFF
jgi:hypothetical protein